MSDKLQELYDNGWKRFLQWSQDTSSKVASDFNLGPEFGKELRELSFTTMGQAILKTAFAVGWKANKPAREDMEAQLTLLRAECEAWRKEYARYERTLTRYEGGVMDEPIEVAATDEAGALRGEG